MDRLPEDVVSEIYRQLHAQCMKEVCSELVRHPPIRILVITDDGDAFWKLLTHKQYSKDQAGQIAVSKEYDNSSNAVFRIFGVESVATFPYYKNN